MGSSRTLAASRTSSCSPTCSTSTIRCLSLSDELAATLAQVRELSERYKSGGSDAFDAFRDLVSLILNATVLHSHSAVRLSYGQGPDLVLGGWDGPTDPLRLMDGNHLRLSIALYREETPEGPRVKVRASSFQYQLDPEGERWIFRYDYLRNPPAPYPACHLQIRGTLIEAGGPHLERVHFPTHRVSIEAVIRLLIEEFGVRSRTEPDFWRAVLAESEAAFLDIHHRSLSGPNR